MKTLYQVVAALAATSTNNHVILSLTNDGGSLRLPAIADLFTEEQIDAMEESCVISTVRDLPEEINTPEKLRYALELADATLLTFHWVIVTVEGERFEYNIDSRNVF